MEFHLLSAITHALRAFAVTVRVAGFPFSISGRLCNKNGRKCFNS